MSLRYLDHVNLSSARVDALVAFYRDVLGMVHGPRPVLSFGGAWLYCGERAVIHINESAGQPAGCAAPTLEHFAFAGDDFDTLIGNLTRAHLSYDVQTLQDGGVRQVHLADPDGNHVHVDFR